MYMKSKGRGEIKYTGRGKSTKYNIGSRYPQFSAMKAKPSIVSKNVCIKFGTAYLE